MKVTVLRECGYEEALLGMGLSYGLTSNVTDIDDGLLKRLHDIAVKLSSKEEGHAKFLESICVWLDITAPRYFWQQLSTYRIGVSTQSESTMHTILKRPLTQKDFERPIPPSGLRDLNILVKNKLTTQLKNQLPEGFLQRRIVCLNYKALRHIISQRDGHKLTEWHHFCNRVVAQASHPEFLMK